MATRRFRYPGQHSSDRVWSGAVTPIARRATRMGSVSSEALARGMPRFGRRVYGSRRDTYTLTWQLLSHVEAESFITQWSDVERGAALMTYTPDDGSFPISVVSVGAPRLVYLNGGAASVEVTLREQR